MPPGVFAAPPGVFNTLAAPVDTSDSRTTLVLRNLPSAFRQAELLPILEEAGLAAHVNFVYLPTDFRRGAGLGYAFLDMSSSVQAQKAKAQLNGFCAWKDPACRKVLEVVWSSQIQGLKVLVEKYRNSRVMHPNVPDMFKPALFENGMRVPFPAPTKRVRSPM
jgi:RNA recognition motif-containing protein